VIVGVGIDIVDVTRFAHALERTPSLAGRLFTRAEREPVGSRARSAASFAARFAAKEAVAKALGAPRGLRWHDVEVVTEPSGRPALLVGGTVAEAAAGLQVTGWQVSLSHDCGSAIAVVLAQR